MKLVLGKVECGNGEILVSVLALARVRFGTFAN